MFTKFKNYFFINVKNDFHTILCVAMVTKLKDFFAMDTTVVLNSFPKTYIFITAFFISVKINFHTIFVLAMLTKFRNLNLLYDFFAMETTVVLNNFPKSIFFVSTFQKTTFIQFCLVLWLPNSIIQADSVILEIAVVLIIFQIPIFLYFLLY